MIYNEQTVKAVEKAIKVLEKDHNLETEKWIYNKFHMEFEIYLKEEHKIPYHINSVSDLIKSFPFHVGLYEHRNMNQYDIDECAKDKITANPYPIFLLDDVTSHMLEENIKYLFGGHLYKIKSIEPELSVDYSKEYSRKYFNDDVNYVGKKVPRCSMFIKEFKINLEDSLTDYILLEDKGSIFEIKDQKDVFYKLCNKLRYPKRRVKF